MTHDGRSRTTCSRAIYSGMLVAIGGTLMCAEGQLNSRLSRTTDTGPVTGSKVAAIITALTSAILAVIVSYIALGVCLGQLLEDVRPSLVLLVNVGAVALLLAVGIATFRYVLARMSGSSRRSAG